jgi:hypothetical protein
MTMPEDSLQRLLAFLQVLRTQGIHFRIERQSPDALMITFSQESACVEVNFSVSDMSFSYFHAVETGDMNDGVLVKLLQENWAD